MAYSTPPTNLRSLEKRIHNLAPNQGLALRRQVTMAMIVVGQMLPEGAVKGGIAMALRYGQSGSRFTQDLDAARVQSLEGFRDAFEDSLRKGWEGFTGRLIARQRARPKGVPASYVMQPFDVKLDYLGRPWRTVKFELGHNEIDDVENPIHVLAADLAGLFTDIGLPAPRAIAVMRADHQIAQKLHAISTVDSDRARDLVDLQLLVTSERIDLQELSHTCIRLFAYRQQQPWPTLINIGEEWDMLYAAAAEGLDVLADVKEAVAWVNELIESIAAAKRL